MLRNGATIGSTGPSSPPLHFIAYHRRGTFFMQRIGRNCAFHLQAPRKEQCKGARRYVIMITKPNLTICESDARGWVALGRTSRGEETTPLSEHADRACPSRATLAYTLRYFPIPVTFPSMRVERRRHMHCTEDEPGNKNPGLCSRRRCHVKHGAVSRKPLRGFADVTRGARRSRRSGSGCTCDGEARRLFLCLLSLFLSRSCSLCLLFGDVIFVARG